MDARAAGVLVCCLVALAGATVGPATAVDRGATASEPLDPAASVDGVESIPSAEGGAPSVQEENGTDGGGESEAASIEGYDAIHVQIGLTGGNGSATWTVQYRYRLEDDNETEAWTALRDGVREDPDSYVSAFEERWTDEVDAAIAETGREMELSEFSVEATNQSGVQEYGFVTFEFRWSSFAHVELNRIEAGDALEGFVLDDRTQLMVEWPPAYNVTGIEPAPDDRRETSAFWYGDETEFVDGEPRIELIRTDGTDIDDRDDTGEGLPAAWLVAAAAAVLAVVGGAGWFVTRNGPAPDGGSASVPPGSGEPPTEEESGPPPELLSNEERVLRLLEDSGGRIKQQEVVSELGWTEAKTSQVVGDLREAGTIDVFRIGRENVLTLPDERVDPSDDGDALEDG